MLDGSPKAGRMRTALPFSPPSSLPPFLNSRWIESNTAALSGILV